MQPLIGNFVIPLGDILFHKNEELDKAISGLVKLA